MAAVTVGILARIVELVSEAHGELLWRLTEGST